MLRACRRLLRPGGRLAFFTILPTPDLTPDDYRRALALGPRAVATRRRRHEEMLASTGFEAVTITDLTHEFRATSKALLELESQHEDDLRPAIGDELFYGRQIQLEESIEGIDSGLLQRALFTARRPS